MRAIAFVDYTTAGAVAGAAFTGLGATLLHPLDPDAFDRQGAALGGLIGGATTHALYGLLSAFDHSPGLGPTLRRVGRSMPMAAITSGILGGAILGLSGYEQGTGPAQMVVSGLLGGFVLSSVAAVGIGVAHLLCCRAPLWTRIGAGDLEEGERLMEQAEQQEAERSASWRLSMAGI